jgi:hypothetical protein
MMALQFLLVPRRVRLVRPPVQLATEVDLRRRAAPAQGLVEGALGAPRLTAPAPEVVAATMGGEGWRRWGHQRILKCPWGYIGNALIACLSFSLP